jgi:predicted permease
MPGGLAALILTSQLGQDRLCHLGQLRQARRWFGPRLAEVAGVACTSGASEREEKPMIVSVVAVLLPVFFVLGLGYLAGRAKEFDADQRAGLNELVLDYALPAMLFVATVRTPRAQLLNEGPFVIALFIAFVGLFTIMVLASTRIFRHSLGEAALQANLTSYPSVAFFGPPIFQGLFGPSSLISITLAATIAAITIVPLTVVLLEMHQQHKTGSDVRQLKAIVLQSSANTFKQPMVWAPMIGVGLVVLGLPVPQLVDNMLRLIGSTTSGASIFLAGLIIAAYDIKVDREIIANVLVKMIVQPLFMAILIAALGIRNPLAREAIVICAIPTAVLAPLLAPRYSVYEVEASSTLIAAAVTMIVTLPLTILLIEG